MRPELRQTVPHCEITIDARGNSEAAAPTVDELLDRSDLLVHARMPRG